MKKIGMFFIAILVIAMATVGCSKATATGPSNVVVIDPTETTTVAVVPTATATETTTVGETPEGTVVATATNTSTDVPTPAYTATPLTVVYVRVIVEVSSNPLIMGSADINIVCGGYGISGVGMTLPYDSSFSSMSNQGVVINTSSPGVPTRVRVLISNVLSDLTDVNSTAFLFPFVDATGETIATDLIPFSYQY